MLALPAKSSGMSAAQRLFQERSVDDDFSGAPCRLNGSTVAAKSSSCLLISGSKVRVLVHPPFNSNGYGWQREASLTLFASLGTKLGTKCSFSRRSYFSGPGSRLTVAASGLHGQALFREEIRGRSP